MKNAKREIIGLALLLEEVSDLVVFCRYSGHVKSVNIEVCDDERGRNTIFDKRFYVDFHSNIDEKNYLDIKQYLQNQIDKATAII
jgi:hypothetical protein